jgi:uncharacterized protein YoxC
MVNGLDTTNTWLAIVAIAAVAQVLLFAVMGVMLVRLGRSITTAIERFEQRHLVPFTSNAAGVAGDLRDVLAGVREVENDIRAQLRRLDDAATAAKHAVLHRLWPVVGLGRAVSVAARSLTTPRRPPSTTVNARPSRVETS